MKGETMLEPPPESEIFIPTEADRDHAAERQMRQGRSDLDPHNVLYDPWFRDAEHAQNWTPKPGVD
jgi:hypothetical protein